MQGDNHERNLPIAILDARHLAPGTTLHTDTCIVGAGPAGITLALELADRGREVLLLESGGLGPASGTQALLAGESDDAPFPPLNEARLACLGGTTAAWSGWCRPLDPIDFEERDWVPHSGWPFAAAHLEPFYRRAHELCGVSQPDYRPDSWARRETSPLQLGESPVRTALFHLRPKLHFGRAHRAGLAASPRITTLLHATALELELSPAADSVTGVRLALPGGRETRVVPRIVVVAGGGIENPRLLLLSDRVVPGGIGNGHDLVGRFFMEHPYVNSGSWLQGGSTAARFYRPHAVPGSARAARVSGVFTLDPDLVRRERLTNSAIFLRPAYRADSIFQTETVRAAETLAAWLRRGALPPEAGRRIAAVARRPDRLARALRLRLGAGGPGGAGLRAFTEPVPDPRHRVTLTSDRDALGRRRVLVQWRPGALELWSLRRAHELLDQALRRSGLGELALDLGGDDGWPASLSGACHHIGTTRMHRDPRRGVVDEHCRVHGVANLYLAGSSVFPTAGYANPTLTIVALAVRLGGRL